MREAQNMEAFDARYNRHARQAGRHMLHMLIAELASMFLLFFDSRGVLDLQGTGPHMLPCPGQMGGSEG
jgi:hypothetical protein